MLVSALQLRSTSTIDSLVHIDSMLRKIFILILLAAATGCVPSSCIISALRHRILIYCFSFHRVQGFIFKMIHKASDGATKSNTNLC